MVFLGGYRVSVLLLLTCTSCILMAAAADYAKYKDPKQPLNRRIGDLLARMTVAEKIGQMSQIERENATADVVKEFFIGIVYALHVHFSWRAFNLSTVRRPGCRQRAERRGQRPGDERDAGGVGEDGERDAEGRALHAPRHPHALYGIDAVHGHGNVYRATIFPHNVGLGCTRYLGQ